MIGIGKFHKDSKGAGRIYIPKEIVKNLNYESGDRLLIKIVDSRIEIRKLTEEVVNNEG